MEREAKPCPIPVPEGPRGATQGDTGCYKLWFDLDGQPWNIQRPLVLLLLVSCDWLSGDILLLMGSTRAWMMTSDRGLKSLLWVELIEAEFMQTNNNPNSPHKKEQKKERLHSCRPAQPWEHTRQTWKLLWSSNSRKDGVRAMPRCFFSLYSGQASQHPSLKPLWDIEYWIVHIFPMSNDNGGHCHLNTLNAREREVENDWECHPRTLPSSYADICLFFLKVFHFIWTFPDSGMKSSNHQPRKPSAG